MASKVNDHPKVKTLLNNSLKEISAYCHDESGELLKARADILFTGSQLIFADFKTIRDTSDDYIQKEIANRLYYFSAAMY